MERVKTGIEDLDEMLNGGIPQGCVIAIIAGDMVPENPHLP